MGDYTTECGVSDGCCGGRIDDASSAHSADGPPSRRGFSSRVTAAGGVITLSSAGVGTAAAGGSDAGSEGEGVDNSDEGDDGNGGEGETDVSDVDVLNFALMLEHLEAAYYNEFLESYSESEVESSSVAKVLTRGNDRYTVYQKIEMVRDHEEAHVETLTQTIEDLGGEPVEPAEYEFGYESIEEFAALSATIEAVGVSAYAGAAPLVENEDLIPPALAIHSVEARHTSYFNVLNTTSPFPDAFDEPRTMEEVLEIASQFIVGVDDVADENDGDGDEGENSGDGDDGDDGSEGDGQLSIADLRAATGSGSNPRAEYVTYENTGDGTLGLSGWTVANGRGTTYSFPDGFALAPGETVTLYTGRGTDTESELYWGKPEEVWNDQLDTMIVRDATGAVALRRSYP